MLLKTMAGVAVFLTLGACATSGLMSGATGPSRYLAAWTGDADLKDSDFLAVLDVEPRSPQYGRVVTTVPIGMNALQPHHTEHFLDPSGILFGSGWAGDRTFRFDLRQPERARLLGEVLRPKDIHFLHSFVRLPNGHVLATYQAETIRVAVPYSRTLFFNDRGTQMGLTADALYEFQRWLNRKHSLSHRPITVLPIPTTRDQLFPKLRKGYAEIAAANLTITAARRAQVDFSDSIRSSVSEIVVIRKTAPPLTHIDQLAGREVHVRKTSSYYDSLVGLNKRFRKEGKPPIKITFVLDALEDEDMMEMVATGLLQIIVVDDWKAELWANILPTIQPLPGIVLRSGAQTGWAMRKNTPTLRRVVNQFIAEQLQGTRTAAVRLANYQKRFKSVRNSTDTAEWKKFERTIELFKTYGEKYRFDHLMLAAQGYQESRLDQQARSRSGAIGIMQILPSTGKQLGVGDITKAEPNIHGGTKYMRQLFDQYFRDADFDEQNRALFAFASYNTGPGRIAKIRDEAKHRGLNANKWFNNVEIVASKRLGQETVQYVRNIYKYYTAYRLQLDTLAAQGVARRRVAAGEPAKG